MSKKALKTEEIILGNKITLKSGKVHTTFDSNIGRGFNDSIEIYVDKNSILDKLYLFNVDCIQNISDLIIVLQGIEEELKKQ